jgi:hypothetical protein
LVATPLSGRKKIQLKTEGNKAKKDSDEAQTLGYLRFLLLILFGWQAPNELLAQPDLGNTPLTFDL